jgi:hypothetical protein
MGDLEERETISSRSRPAARSVTPAPIIEDHAQRSRIPIATASSETEVAGEGLHGDRQAMVEACKGRRSAHLHRAPDRRTGEGVTACGVSSSTRSPRS